MPEPEMTPAMYGAEISFAGVPRAALASLSDGDGYDVVFVGAPFDGGTTNRPGPGSGRRPSAAPTTCRRTAPGRTSRSASTRSPSCGSPTSGTC